MTLVVCPHCSGANDGASAFCQSCGKALPDAQPSGPRVIANTAFASTSAGQKLQAYELHRQARRAAGALLTVALIQFVFGMIFLMRLLPVRGQFRQLSPAVYILIFGSFAVSAMFVGLYVWARVNPLPPSIVGLVLYIVVSIGSYMLTAQIYSAAPAGRVGTTPLPWGKLIITFVLVRAVAAALRHRKLMQEMDRSL
jgi:hypothetical protein